MERPRLRTRRYVPGNRERGFTLFELLVVMLIVGLATAVVAPRWVAALPGVQLSTAARKTAAVLRYAGNRAAAEQQIFKATVSLWERRVSLYRITLPTAGRETDPQADTDTLVSAYALPEDVTVASAVNGAGDPEPDRLNVFFYPDGANSGGQITLANDRDRRLVIHVDFITGAVRVSEPSDA